MAEEEFDRFLKQASQLYREPPPTPKEEIWDRLQSRRRREADDGSVTVVDLAARRHRVRWVGWVVAAAAVLLFGIAIGRFGLPRSDAPAVVAAGPDSINGGESVALRLATVAALSQVSALLVDYDADRINEDFTATARELLSTTRLLLASPRLSDPATRLLLEDLELVLVQITRLNRSGQGDERGFIDDGMAERAIRQRLGRAIPAGPTA